MTVQDVINQVRAQRSSTFSDAQLVGWLNECEGYVQMEVLLWPIHKVYRYDLSETVTFSPGMEFPDRQHVFLPSPADFPAGGTVTISGLVNYTANNGGPYKIINLSDDKRVLTFDDDTFSMAGEGPDSGTVTMVYAGGGAELLVLPPYDKLYVPYIIAQIAFAQEEWDAYENYKAMYNEYMSEFKRFFARTYRPADRKHWGCLV